MKTISNYTILEKLDETRGSIIYRGRKENETKTYIIKELKSSSPTLSEIAQFRQEYEIIKKINIEGVIKTYDILEYDNNIALVLEDFDGISLKKILKDKNINLDLKLFLTIAIKLSNALGHLHKENIVHKDIKPHNILFNAATGELKIADFGISNEITHENNEVYNPVVIEGTLVYLSPEQTGRMNRQLDYRTDMYSLGITFYELLTGSVPFQSKDPLMIIHQHLAIEAKPPAERDPSLPEVISNIVMKLLSKIPEERFQNCFGVMSDLKECLKQLEATGKINEFKPGQNDISPMFIVPQVLVGREEEIKRLMKTVRRINSAGEQSEILLVSGEPGIGKSALINEAHKSILSKRGYFIPGKFDQFRKDVPYSALIQAFKGLVNQVLSEDRVRIEQWKDDILAAIGPNGQVIIDMIPEMELIIGEQPNIPELGPEQNQNRFNYVFGNFADVLATKNHPVVLFLDDLQWADLASLNLINLIITDKDIKYFLIIGTYRDNEVDASHSLAITLDTIREAGVPINTINLDVLNPANVNEMIYHFLRCPREASLPLAELVHRKTNGNPFFVNQFMKTLYKENLLKLDPVQGWQWEITKIRKTQITDNVVELMAQKITKLPLKTQEVLKICACTGNRFDLEIISKIHNRSIRETLKETTHAVYEGILRIDREMYRFQHDRIQEAAYSLVPKEEKEELHYGIGNLLLETTKEKDLQDEILYIIDHLNAGSALISSAEERNTLARLNLRGGNKAKASAAYKSALQYLKTGIALITQTGEEFCWEKQYELSLSLYTEAGEAAYLHCNYAEMEHFTGVVLKQARSLPDTVKIYVIKIQANLAQNKLIEAISIGLDALKSFGTRFPKKPGMLHIAAGLVKTNLLFLGKSSDSLLKLPMMEDPLHRGVIRLLAGIGSPSYFAEPNLLPLIAFKLLKLTIAYGNSAESPYSYCGYGLILCSIGSINSGYEFGKLGLDLLERMNRKDQVPRTHLLMNGFIRHWKKHLGETIEPLRTGFQIGLEIGDLEFAAHSAMMLCNNSYNMGRELKGFKREIAQFSTIVEKIKQKTQLQMINMVYQVILNLQDTSKEAYYLRGEIYNEDIMLPLHTTANDKTALSTLYLYKSTLCYLFHEYAAAFDYLKSAEIHLEALRALYDFCQFYFYNSLIRLALYDSLPRLEKKKTLKRVAQNQKKLKKWMRLNPANNANKFYLVEAEGLRILGKNREAMECYDKSISHAHKNGFIQEKGIAHERAAQFWQSIKKEFYAGTHMRAAHECYAQWGAAAKVKQLEDKYARLLGTVSGENTASEDSTEAKTFSTNSTETLDLSTVMKAAQTISGEIVLEKLLDKMMTILLENAGAQKAFLILENESNKKLYIEAEGMAHKKTRIPEPVPLENNDTLSTAIVNYVNTSKKNLVLNNASEEGMFAGDPYIKRNKPKSILCGPIMNKGNMAGIVYLENNLITNAFTPERLKLLRLLSSQVAISIENARLVAHREDAAKLKKEMEIAATIQTGLLPQNPEIKNFEISAYMQPADDIGGDYYDIINAHDRDWIAIGDVSGHGVPAGLIMMMVQTAIHTAITQNPDLSPSELLTIINTVLKENIARLNEDKYMTITVFAAHENGTVMFSGLHQDILIFRAHSNTVDLVETQGMWIGMPYNIQETLTDDSFVLDTGDTMLVYTDGITEAWKKGSLRNGRDPLKDMFRKEKLLDIFGALGNGPIEEIKNGVLTELEDYECDDDVTLVLVRRLR
ncbi:MAG: AAA family ATPase [bacterium]|nr:AAA family ATPase [bacterium]